MTHAAFDPVPGWRIAAMQELRRHAGFYLGLGIAPVILGLVVIGLATLATILTVVFLGFWLILGGIVQAGHAFATRTWSGFFLHLLGSIFYVVAGLLMVANPGLGAVALTLMLAAFFMVTGLFRIIGAVIVRFPSWGWVVLNGAVTLLLGILIAAGWPAAGLWVIGLFVGIDMVVTGWSFIMLAMAARRLGGEDASPHTPPPATA